MSIRYDFWISLGIFGGYPMHRRKPSQVNVPKFDKQSPAPALGLVWKWGVPKNSPLFDSHFHGETTDDRASLDDPCCQTSQVSHAAQRALGDIESMDWIYLWHVLLQLNRWILWWIHCRIKLQAWYMMTIYTHTHVYILFWMLEIIIRLMHCKLYWIPESISTPGWFRSMVMTQCFACH